MTRSERTRTTGALVAIEARFEPHGLSRSHGNRVKIARVSAVTSNSDPEKYMRKD